MEVLLKYRVAFITALFAVFGKALTRLLKIDELNDYYTALAPLLALAISLLISFLIKTRWDKKWKNRLKAISFGLFLCLLFAVFLYTRFYLSSTFKYADANGNVAYYVKGSKDSYTPAAIQFRKDHPAYVSDQDLIRHGFINPTHKGLVWSEDSINNNILWLVSGYCIVVILFVGLISMLLEILELRYKPKNKPARPAKVKTAEAD